MSNQFKKRTIQPKYYRPQKIRSFNSQTSAYHRKPKKRSLASRLIFNKKNVSCLSIVVLIAVISFFIFISRLSKDLPNPDQLIERDIAQSTTIYDRSGENILYEFHGDEKRTLIDLNDIPDHAKQATIAIEDKNFYKHGGFSVWAMIRTAVTNVLYGKRAGGSTLTQQFVKNALLSPEKKYSRKIKEILIAQRIEQRFEKDEILQMYLNEIPYGSNAYGIEAASQKYFGKSARDLALAESAILAALPQAPSRYSPYGPNKELLIGRQQYILGLMVEQGYISLEEKDRAIEYEIVFKGPETNIVAPHFVMYIREILAEKYGENILEQSGLKIYTTIDLEKQKFAEEAIKNQVDKNLETYNASNAALVAIDPKNGQILAMVGSKDYFNQAIDGQVNVATRLRQPGSSLKPLVYASLLSKGYTPNTILYDVVTNFSASGQAYEPRNYNNQERGPISIKEALAGSLNIPAVKAIYLAGINNVISLAQESGYTTLNDPDRYGLSLVLGGAEVKLLEHVNAYSVFAREGEVSPITGILKIEDNNGKILEEFQERKKRVLDVNTSRMINNILSENSYRSFVFGEKNNLIVSGKTVAAKTGTTNNFRDAWTVGYTPSLVAGVWVGNNDNSEMNRGADGSVIAAPIWNEFMKKSLEGKNDEPFFPPEIKETGKDILDGKLIGKTIKINTADGTLANNDTPAELIEEVFFPQHHSILYHIDKDDPLGKSPSHPEKDPQFILWEERILEWAKKQDSDYDPSLVDDAENIYNPENIPVFEILNLANNQTISSNILSVKIDATAPRGIHKIEYYLNNNLIDKKISYPFDLEQDISFLSNGYYNLKILVCDDVLNCSEKSIEFNLLLSENNQKLPPNLNLIFPTSGISLNPIDFPLNIQMVTTNPEQIIKVELFLKDKNNSVKKIQTLEPVLSKAIEIEWTSIPENGTYKLYGELHDWNGSTKKSNEITVNIY